MAKATDGDASRHVRVDADMLWMGVSLAPFQELPDRLAGGLTDRVTRGGASSPSPTPSINTSTVPKPKASASARKSGAVVKKPPAKGTVPVAPASTCANLTAGKVAKIVGRKVQPVADRSGCSWGTPYMTPPRPW